MTKRGSYVKWGNTDKDGYGQINIKNIKDNVLPTDINDYNIVLDNNIYMPGTANHELGHVADGLAGSRKIQDFDSGKEYITNTYLNYLANSNNTYSSAELRKMGLFDAAGSRSYLLNPTEAKSHMLTLKRSLKDSGKITNWSTPVDENMILEYMRNPTSNKMVKNQYDLYRNKNEYIDRLNKLIPMENLYPVYPIPSYKDGGIHIKKKNRGKFNALKKRTGKSTEELTHSKNPLTRKRAVFAQNAAKWNHKGRKKK